MKMFCIPLGIIQANCYILVDKSSKTAAVIDPGGFDKELLDLLKSEEISAVKYILLTHGHYDHILGVFDFREYTNAQVAIHKLDAPCLWDEKESLSFHIKNGIQKYLHPDFHLENGMELQIGQTVIKALHTPGHTAGGVCFLCEKEKKIYTGDTLFYHTVGRTDLPGGNMQILLQSIGTLFNLAGDYTVYPGHNRPSTLAEERLHNRFARKIQ